MFEKHLLSSYIFSKSPGYRLSENISVIKFS